MITIEGRLSGLNEYTRACRSNAYQGANLKKVNEQQVYYSCLQDKEPKHTGKVFIKFKWYEKDQKRDPDNIAFAKKFILDALVQQGILQGDGWRHIAGFSDELYIDKDRPRIEIIINDTRGL